MGGWYYEEWKTVISLRSRRGRSNRRRGRILQPRLINALNWQTIWTHNRRNRNRKKTPTGITFKNLLFVFSPLNISSNFSFIKIWLKPSEISLSQIFFFFFHLFFLYFRSFSWFQVHINCPMSDSFLLWLAIINFFSGGWG